MPSFMRQINVIGRCSAMVRNQKLADTGLTGWHYSYILTLCRNPGQSQEHLARHIYINKSNVTRHLTQLEKNGYVERRQSEEDKRVMLVYPTDKAYEVLPRVREVVRSWNSFLTEDFTPEEMEQFNSMLERITRKATEAVNKELGED